MTTVTDADREAAAKAAVLVEFRDLILAGKADHHAEPWAEHREAEVAKIVAWLRNGADYGVHISPATQCNYDRLADAIEAGEYRNG